MRKVAYLLLCLVTAASATQWGPRTLAPGVNTTGDDYPQTIASNGDMYKLRSSLLYLHAYLGGYNWSTTAQPCNGLGTIGCATIDPGKREGLIGDDYDVLPITSLDGINWTRGSAMSAWNRNPHYPTGITCAWRSVGKELQVDYEDGKKFWAPYPYTNPQEITNLGFVVASGLRFSGDYLAVSNNSDLFESFGSGGTWSTRQPITEVNTGDSERCPTLGAIGGYNILLWSAPGSVGGYDIYYSKGSSNSAISPTSLGRVKAMFR